MPIEGEQLRKFEAIRKRLDATSTEYAKARRPDTLVDALDFDDVHERWENLYAQMVSLDPEISFVPKPTKPAKSDNKAAYQGRGGYSQADIWRTLRAMDEVWSIVTHPTKVAAQVTIGREGIFVGGQPFDAMMAVTSIIRDAKRSLVLIDAYVDEQTLSILTFKGEKVPARILTKQAKPTLVTAAKSFVAQYGPTLEIRTSPAFHDRFIVVDDADYFHFGTSLNSVGKKNTFMFSRIEESAVIATLKTAITDTWTKGTPVPL